MNAKGTLMSLASTGLFGVNDTVVLVNLECRASLPTSAVSSYNLNVIILSDGQGWNLVLTSQVFGERGHDLPVNVAKGTERPFTYKGIELRFGG